MNPVYKFLDNLFTQKRWSIHLLFWLAVLLLYAVFFGRRNDNYGQTLFFVGLLMPVTIGTTYLFNYYLMPVYLMRGRYLRFVAYSFYALLLALFLEMMVALLTFLVMAQLKIKEMSPASIDIFFLLATLLMVVLLGVSIKMVLHWRSSKEANERLMREKVETELRFLKAQLNPHFLFNTLNNLYYLASEKSDHAPRAILQLSEILDYVMRSGKSTLVPLGEEVKQVTNFVALEMLRYHERVRVNSELMGNMESATIAPMMLITLMENAFKHGVMPRAQASWIDWRMQATQGKIEVTFRNSWSPKPISEGIGLQNLKNQLDYLYPGRYTLFIHHEPTEFSVNLTLQPVL